MHRRQSVLPVFIFFISLSLLIYLLRFTGLSFIFANTIDLITGPFRYGASSVYAAKTGQMTPLQMLRDENAELSAKLAGRKSQEKEIQALRDQFQTAVPFSTSLLPAKIVGLRTFIPGVSLPDQMILGVGSRNGVRVNNAVVYKNNLIGKVRVVNNNVSLVDLVYAKNFSVTATTAGPGSLGISKGQGQGSVYLENVVLSDKLQKGDLVVTKGSVDSDENGIPSDLVIGKIASVDKKASNLFQSARVIPLIDFTRISLVFVIKGSK